MTKTLAKLGEDGSLVIPAEYRKALGVETGDELVLVLEEGSLRVLIPAEGVRRARTSSAPTWGRIATSPTS